jgi:hypothetical protein
VGQPTITLRGDRYGVDLTYLDELVEGARVHPCIRACISGDYNEETEAALEHVSQTATDLDAVASGRGDRAALVSLDDNFEVWFDRKAVDHVHVVVIPGVVEFSITQRQMTDFAHAFRRAFVK